jgi:nucleotide-binding universal stress UspA family protein
VSGGTPPTADTTGDRQGRVRCLVVGYDGHPAARAAVGWAAAQLAGNGRIVVVQAYRPLLSPTELCGSAGDRRRLAGASVDELLLEAPRQLLEGELDVEVSDEDPVSALIAAAERHGAEAIVLGAQRHSSLRKLLGTVTSELIERSPVPVTVVPA